MEFSNAGVEFLTEREGFKCNPYLDVAGLPTIGVGHLLTSLEKDQGFIIIGGERCYYLHRGLTVDRVKRLLKQDCASVVRAIGRYVHVQLTQNQFDALVSFVFNVGTGAFSQSTLLKVLNHGEYEAVPDQLRRWNKSGGKVREGLTVRRELECLLWSEGKYRK